MEKLFLMTLNITRSGYGIMHGLTRGQGVIGHAILIVRGTSRGGEKICKTEISRTGRGLQCRTKDSKIQCHHRMQQHSLHLHQMQATRTRCCRRGQIKGSKILCHHRMQDHLLLHPIQVTRTRCHPSAKSRVS
ncbi:multiple organellar RNA editing factor 8, chloroplastic/mitochondrial-like [Iris pallida]|uniref:Multiple organellar RNA editing factor 8, chloroplastic/mitochondrial-like n=1 Tax=Iris pallida TaxID=29817 RepID=A0AAX6GKU9_IRIPA|nr:multiple organellar RNA editing factor 8, chloroplastic/mitochondrial-like [Iris pallida]